MSELTIATIAGILGFLLARNSTPTQPKNQTGGKSKITVSEEQKRMIKQCLRDCEKIQYYHDIDKRLKYQNSPDKKNIIHIGQLKLFLTEVEFLTEFYSNHNDNIIMVYAGSAPCHHASYLSKMFPNLKIVMIDPHEHLIMYDNDLTSYSESKYKETVYLKCAKGNRFRIKDRIVQMFDGTTVKVVDRESTICSEIGDDFTKKLDEIDYLKNFCDFIMDTDYKYYIIEDYFTNKLAEFFSSLGTFVFCSDIRTNIDIDSEPSDLDILWNSAMQYNWIHIMQPKAIMLKFRCPFFNHNDISIINNYKLRPDYRQDDFNLAKKNGIDFLKNYENKQFIYYKPKHIYIQAFQPYNSAETRLVTSNYNTLSKIDISEYEEKMFYYNQIPRLIGFHLQLKTIFDEKYGIDGCTDCFLMFKIFKDYYHKYYPHLSEKKIMNNIKNDMIGILASIKRDLREHGTEHGKKFKQNTFEEIMTQLE